MPRKRRDPYLKRRPGRRSWYIWDGDAAGGWISTGCADEGAARQVLADYLRAKATGPIETVGDMLDARLESLEGKARYEVARYLIPRLRAFFGPLRPDQIDEHLCRRYVETLPHSKGRSDLEELKAALPDAWKRHVQLPKPGPPRTRFLSPEQQSRLLDAAGTHHLWLYILIALSTGARNGAILDLTWDRVADDGAWADFRNPALPETNKRRTIVPVSEPLRSALLDARMLAITDHVIEWEGRPVLSVKRAFASAATRAGVPWCTPHVLKHTAISNLGLAGYTTAQAAKFTATSERTVERVYRHLHVGELANMAASLGAILTGGQETPPGRPASAGALDGRNPLVSQGVPVVGAAGIEPATPTMSSSSAG